MEDPITFDVWAVVDAGGREEAVAELRACTGEKREVDARKAVTRAIRKRRPLLIRRSIGWEDVQVLRARPPSWAKELRILQEAFTPDDSKAGFCAKHDLFYGGSLGGHVCNEFYVRR